MKLLAALVCLVIFSTAAHADKKPDSDDGLHCPKLGLPAGYTAPANAPKNAADIKLVVYAVQQALTCYQEHGTSGGAHLPPLSAATFDFKTSTSLNLSPSISFFIFTLGAGVEKDKVQDFSLTYTVAPKGFAESRIAPDDDFVSELATLIRDAAIAASSQPSAANLPLNSVTVTVQFGIQTNLSVGASFPISFVTAGAKLAKNKNTADTVTLTFKSAPVAHP